MGAVKSKILGDFDPAVVKQKTTSACEAKTIPFMDEFDSLLDAALKEAHEKSLADELDLEQEKSDAVRKEVWEKNDYEKKYTEMCEALKKDIDENVWPEVEKDIDPKKAKIMVPACKKAMEAARDLALKDAKAACLDPPLFDRYMKKDLDKFARSAYEPYRDDGWKKHIAEQEEAKKVKREDLNSTDLSKFYFECYKSAKPAESDEKIQKEIADNFQPKIKRKVERKKLSGKNKLIAENAAKAQLKAIPELAKKDLLMEEPQKEIVERKKKEDEAKADGKEEEKKEEKKDEEKKDEEKKDEGAEEKKDEGADEKKDDDEKKDEDKEE